MSSRSDDSRNFDDRLSQAASETLDELLATRRVEIIERAFNETRRTPLTATDIVRAYYATSENRATSVTLTTGPLSARWEGRESSINASIAVVAFLAIIALTIVASLQQTLPEAVTSAVLTATSALLGVIAFAAFSFNLRARRRHERTREEWLQKTLDDNDGVRLQDIDGSAVRLRDLKDGEARETVLRGQFLILWNQIEGQIESITDRMDRIQGLEPRTMPFGDRFRRLEASNIIPDRLLSNLRLLLKNRNALVHRQTLTADLDELVDLAEESLRNLAELQ